MAEVGTVYVSVMPSTKGFAKVLGSQGSVAGTAAGNQFNLSFGKLIGGSALGNIISNAWSKVTASISSSIDSAVSRVDTIANFPKIMSNLGFGANEATNSINALSTGIEGMPTSLDSIVSMTQQLAPLCGGLDKATELSLAMNNMFLASRASTADQTRAMQQYTQMLSRGKVELNDWRTLQEVMPGQLNQVAQALLGPTKNSTDLYEALKSGKVKLDDFNETVKRLNTEGSGEFASFEQQARSATEGIGTAMENWQNRISKAVGKFIDHIGQANISNFINGISSNFTVLADQAISFWDSLTGAIDFAGFEAAFKGWSDAIGEVFGQGDNAATFGEQVGSAANALIPIIQGVTPGIQFAATVVKYFIDNGHLLIPLLILMVVAFKGLGVVQSITPMLQIFTGGLTTMKPVVQANVGQMLSLAVVAVSLGAGIALACAGVSLLVLSAIQLSNAGPMAYMALFSLVAIVAVFAVGLAVLGPVLTANTVGIVAFGAAILMVSVGVLAACTGIAILSLALPGLSQYGLTGAAAIVLLGTSMLMAAPGAIVLAAGLALLAVGSIAAGAGLVVLSAGSMAAFIGLMLCVTPATILGPMLILAGTGALTLAAALVVIAGASILATPGLVLLAAEIGGVSIAIGIATPAFLALAGALAGSAVALSGSAASMMIIVAAATAISVSLTAARIVCVSLFSGFMMIVPATTAAAQSLVSMSRIWDSQLLQLQNKSQNTVSRITQFFNSMKLRIPSPELGAMPHFSLSGRFDMQAGTVPTINVNWYATGGVFNKPSIIGVGEAGTEVVAPLSKLKGYIADASSSNNSEELQAIYFVLLDILQAIPSFTNRDRVRFVKEATRV